MIKTKKKAIKLSTENIPTSKTNKKLDEEIISVCPDCGSTNLSNDKSEVFCNECGIVVEHNIVDTGPEWRAFDAEQKNKKDRVGAPMTYTIHDKGLSTMIDWRDKDTHGTTLSASKKSEIFRLRKAQNRSKFAKYSDRNLAFALQELSRIESHLGLPKNVRETAALIYREAVEKKLIRGQTIESVAAAAIYAACRKYNIPRTLHEISDASQVDKKKIGRSYRHISRQLKLLVPPPGPTVYISRFASDLELSGKIQTRAIEILKSAMDKGLTSGRGPMGVAAAALYIASVQHGERRTQRDIAEVARVTEVTVRNRYKELAEKLDIFIPT